MAKKNKITFNKNYLKLMGCEGGILLAVDKVFPEHIDVLTISEAFAYHDNVDGIDITRSETHPKADTFLVLTFQGSNYNPFVEIRKCSQSSYLSYSAKVRQEYNFYIKKEETNGKKGTGSETEDE